MKAISARIILIIFVALLCGWAFLQLKIICQMDHVLLQSNIIHTSSSNVAAASAGRRRGRLRKGSNGGLLQMESRLSSVLKKKVTSCRKQRLSSDHTAAADLCMKYDNITKHTHLFIYNPTNRDKFMCGNLVIGPGMIMVSRSSIDRLSLRSNTHSMYFSLSQPVTPTIVDNCGGGDLLLASKLSHSYPSPPRMDNRHDGFPGILVQRQEHEKDDSFSTDLNMQVLENKHLQRFDQCDVKCIVETQRGANVLHEYVYGTPWRLTTSVEGEQYYPEILKIGKDDWKRNQFYGTTSFRSEIPRTYLDLNTTNLQSSGVDFSTAIKGASFLAKNCNSLNDREAVVIELMNSSFRVDSLSTCLNNAEPPEGANIQNKSEIMGKYLFHLAFENQNTDDYITEKLWQTLESGTVPVYLGAENIKDHHLPTNSVIYVSDYSSIADLAKYLVEVTSNETLYNTYHLWRTQPLPKAFRDKYFPVSGETHCRSCRWAHARKYGLGWDHQTQSIKPTTLSRDVCIDEATALLHSPAVESWWEGDGERLWLSPVKVEASHSNDTASLCPLEEEKKVAITRDLFRYVWSNDGVTDILLEGEPQKDIVLRLDFPMKQHEPAYHFSSNTVWIQDDKSRITLVVAAAVDRAARLIRRVQSGSLHIQVRKDSLPLRIRMIIEDLDLHHDGAKNMPMYYGQVMADDVHKPLELFTLVDDMTVAELERAVQESAPKEQQPTPIRPSKVLDRVALIEESDRRKAMVSGWYKRHQKKKNNVT